MRFAILILASCLCLLLPCSSRAQGTDEWEIPGNLKGDLDKPACPEGMQQEASGKCVPKPEPPAPVQPAAAPEKEPTPPAPAAPAPAPAPSATPAAEAPAAPPPPAVPTPAEPAPAPAEPGQASRPALKPSPNPPAAVPAPPGPPAGETLPGAPAAEQPPAVAAEGKEPAPAEAPKPAFYKGELTSFVGSTKLIGKNNRVGVGLGYRYLDRTHYATINPEADIRIDKLTFGLGVPLAFEIFNENQKDPNAVSVDIVGFGDAGHLRTKDWDEAGKYVRVIRYATWGRKEDQLFVNLNQVTSTTLGHGPLMRHYSVNLDPDSARLSAEIDAYNDYVGGEFVVNSVVDWDVFGMLFFVKPLSFFLDDFISRSVSIGVTYLADRDAPVALNTESGLPYRAVFSDDRPVVISDAFLHAMGVDMEVKVVKSDSVDLKPYIDYSWMMPTNPSNTDKLDPSKNWDPEGGGGLTLGVLGRFNFGSDPIQAIRAVAEFRSFSSNYLPSYFDTFYEVQKYMVSQRYGDFAQKSHALPPTKFTEVFINRKNGDRHLGFYLEFSYALVDKLALTLALEGSDAEEGNHFLAHLEVPALSWLNFFVSYQQRAMKSLGDLFSSDGGDKIVMAAMRLKLLPFLFVNFRYAHTFQIQEGYANLDNDPGKIEEHYRYYYPANVFIGDVEFGWEF